MLRSTFLFFMILLLVGCGAKKPENIVYFGTYTKKEGHVDGQAKGIFVGKQNLKNGSLTPLKTAAEVTNPSFVKVTEDGKNLYAVSELGSADAATGFVYSFKRNPDNSLEEIGKLGTAGFAPCHIETDQSGNYVFVSNYVGGVVMMYKRGENGVLKKQQKIELDNPEKSHAHSVTIAEDNKTAYIADLGNDKIWIYNFDSETGRLTPKENAFVELKKGAGPRHFVFSKDHAFAFSINELNSTITSFKVEKDGDLSIIETVSSLPIDFNKESYAADIHLHPTGDFIYASNRGHNSIAAFKLNKKTGILDEIGYYATRGETPRNFAISPNGKYLYAANQDSNSVTIFKIDEQTGELEPHLLPVEVMTPVCIEIVP